MDGRPTNQQILTGSSISPWNKESRRVRRGAGPGQSAWTCSWQRTIWLCASFGRIGRGHILFKRATVHLLHCNTRSLVIASAASDPSTGRDWSRSTNDPFLDEWEHIYAYARTRPMASAGEILREWQRRFPERFGEAHLSRARRKRRKKLDRIAHSTT